MQDQTETIRRHQVAEINQTPSERECLEAQHGQVWNTTELQNEFDVIGFAAPYVVVVRKADNVKGSIKFQGSPRFYFGFKAD